jgi:hypothetical protein
MTTTTASLPASAMSLRVTLSDGQTYQCSGPDWTMAIPYGHHYPVRVVKGGRFQSHSDLVDLVFVDQSTNTALSTDVVTGVFEIVSWPQCVTLRATVHGSTVMSAILTTTISGVERVTTVSAASVGADTDVFQTFCVDGGTLNVYDSGSPTPATDPMTVQLRNSNTDALQATASYTANNGGSYKLTLPSGSGWGGTTAKLEYSESYKLVIGNTVGSDRSMQLEMHRPNQQNIVGLSVHLLDTATLTPSGIPVQLSKNWHSYTGNNIPARYGHTNYQGTWLSAVTVFKVPANSQVELTVVFVYAHYGGIPAASHAQLSLIGWGGGGGVWHESALGSFGENICYDPNGNNRRGMVTDVRPLHVCGMGSNFASSNPSQACKENTWTHNVGGADFLVYFDGSARYQNQKYVYSDFVSTGPCLTNVSYTGITMDDKIRTKVEVSIGRTDRYNKNYHHLHYVVHQETTPARLAFYQLGADHYNDNYFAGAAFGHTSSDAVDYIHASEATDAGWGTASIPDPDPGLGSREADVPGVGYVPGYYRRSCAPSDTNYGDNGLCWFFLPGKGEKTDGAFADRGMIIRHWDAVLGGQRVNNPHFSVLRTSGTQTSGLTFSSGGESSGVKVALEISPPPGVTTLLPGDYVDARIEYIVLPRNAADYNPPVETGTFDYGRAAVNAALAAADAATWSGATTGSDSNRLGTHWGLSRKRYSTTRKLR